MRPNDHPLWAEFEDVDPTYNTLNKVAPSTEKQDFGQRGLKNTLRQDINYLFFTISSWIQFFDKQYDIGTVVTREATGAPTPLELGQVLGGTWEYIDGASGDGTLADEAVKVYRKISEVNV